MAHDLKVSEATGPALDWMVARCEGYECLFDDEVSGPWLVPQEGYLHDEKPLDRFRPSTNWQQGGPIIEREMRDHGFDVWRTESMAECAASYTRGVPSEYVFGPTPLIAAMRCYVASKLGDIVKVPKEMNHGA